MVVVASCFVGFCFMAEDWDADKKKNGAKYMETLEENLLKATKELRLGWRFTLQLNNYSKHANTPINVFSVSSSQSNSKAKSNKEAFGKL